jgi:hypothetical protein
MPATSIGGAFTSRPKIVLGSAPNGTRTSVHSADVANGARRPYGTNDTRRLPFVRTAPK